MKDALYKILYEEEVIPEVEEKEAVSLVKEITTQSALLLPPPKESLVQDLKVKPLETVKLSNVGEDSKKHPFAPRIPRLDDEDFFVAVYGSLKKGFGNHYRLSKTPIEFEGFISGGFDMYSLHAYPGLSVNDESDFGIDVEVYPLTKSLLASLDSLEGYPNFYTRDLVWVRPYASPNDLYSCWVYYIKDTKFFDGRSKVTDVNDKGKISWSKKW